MNKKNDKKMDKIILMLILLIVIVLVFVLLKNRFNDSAKLELVNGADIVLYENDPFIDPGYKIVNNKNDSSGYYINKEENVVTNKVGKYYVKYLLYNKNGKLLDEKIRNVIVLEDAISHVKMTLKGAEDEYFFINDYFDNGITVYKDNNDITNQVKIENNVIPSQVGDYEVKYQITIDGKTKETIRKVHIVDLDIRENIDIQNFSINLIINNSAYDYTLLPNGKSDPLNNINYSYQDIKEYDFDIYLKSGSHKKYTVNIQKMDSVGPVGTCTIYYSNTTTQIVMDASDSSGIKKYSFNGMDFNNNIQDLNGIITNVSVKAYDNFDNATDIKCQAKFKREFKNVTPSKKYIVCGQDLTKANSDLDALMQSYGYKTRDAVAAAALYLAGFDVNIGYQWAGKYTQKGFDSNWGCKKSVTRSSSGRLVCSNVISESSDTCQAGLDCTGYTSWAFAQAGFSKDILRTSSQSTGMWGEFNAKKHKYSFRNNQDKVNLIKPGDIVHIQHETTGHVGIVIGISDTEIQVANEHAGIRISNIRKTDGKSTNGDEDFESFVLFDDFFQMYGN